MTVVESKSYWPLSTAERVVVVPSESNTRARIGVRFVSDGELVDAYPAGAHDRELALEGDPVAEAVRDFAAHVLASDPQCRRIVLPVVEEALAAIAFAEEAGFRYVVDVETRAGAFSLLVTEPDWVLDQPAALENIPIRE